MRCSDCCNYPTERDRSFQCLLCITRLQFLLVCRSIIILYVVYGIPSPLGTHEYMEDNIVTKVKALEPLFEMVATLENEHVSFTLLKFCLGVCKINYLLRVTPVQCTKPGEQLFDKFLENGLRTVVGGDA